MLIEYNRPDKDYFNNIGNSNLDYFHKELLKLFLESENYFLPYTIDGNWDYADCMKVISKVELVAALLNGNWDYKVSKCLLECDVFMVSICLGNSEIKDRILAPYKKFNNHCSEDTIDSKIEVYVPYSFMLDMYKVCLLNSDARDRIILPEDI